MAGRTQCGSRATPAGTRTQSPQEGVPRAHKRGLPQAAAGKGTRAERGGIWELGVRCGGEGLKARLTRERESRVSENSLLGPHVSSWEDWKGSRDRAEHFPLMWAMRGEDRETSETRGQVGR